MLKDSICRVVVLGALAVLPLSSSGARAADDQIARGTPIAVDADCHRA